MIVTLRYLNRCGHIMKYLIISFLILCCGLCYGQSALDVSVEPRPYDIAIYLKNKPGTHIKQIVYFRDFNIEARNFKDTMSVENYDLAGNLATYVRYYGGKRTNVVTYKISADSLTREWQSKELTGRKNVTVDHSVYDAKGKMLFFKNIDLNFKGEVLGWDSTRFLYNERGNLLKRLQFVNGKTSQYKIYRYKDIDMIQAEIRNPYSPGFYSLVEFTYNAIHLPLERRELYVRNNVIEPSGFDRYVYDGKTLVAETYSDSSKPGVEINASYTYDANNRLRTVLVKQDTLYQLVNYEFDAKHLNRITVKTNARNKFYKHIIVWGTSLITVLPIQYEKIFVYDDKDNLIETRQLLNGVLQTDILQKITYY